VDLGLADKAVVITGGGGDIGRECARLFAAAGAKLAISDVKLDAAQAVAAEAERAGASAFALRTDVTDAADVARLFEETAARLGSVDVLVNNAGIFQSKPIDDLSADDWDRVMAVNLKGVFLCSQAALRHMKPRGSGTIVSIGSLAGQVGGIHAAANYATSKAGVISLTKSLAKNAGPHGIRVNCVNPGVIDTQMTQPWPAEVRAQLAKQTPLGRLGRPDEVARAVVYLASEWSSFVHGAHLDVNGGVHMD
jgi:3-oxoacyl-[acyl-carrier protein] reductase